MIFHGDGPFAFWGCWHQAERGIPVTPRASPPPGDGWCPLLVEGLLNATTHLKHPRHDCEDKDMENLSTVHCVFVHIAE